MGNLNVYSVNSKFDQLKCFLPGKVDILVLTENKLDFFDEVGKSLYKYSQI